ncbi:MAG: DNA primase [Alphaproteobacteria bacterium]|nr:DNA primase [Alphaproteobacteria bacterium]
MPLSRIAARKVKLQKSGNEWKGCCPFHNENTPSFYVNDEKAFGHCFGCGAHVDIISFVQRIDHLEFREACEKLAGEAGMEIPRSVRDDAQHKATARIFACLEAAARIFNGALKSAPAARAYLRDKRGFTDHEIAFWGMGYAGGDVAIAALRREGFSADELIEAGLVSVREDKSVYPFFRDRVGLPIRDRRGRVRGFGGRALGDDAKPKYLNSRASAIFAKRELLFGEDIAARQDRRERRLVAGEGYFDVVALDAIGFRGVAPNGTSLTMEHLEALWRMSPCPTLCFDGDKAGASAMDRTIDLALEQIEPGRSLRFARLPAGEDPDSLRKAGRDGDVIAAVEGSIRLSDAMFARRTRGRNLDVPEDRAAAEAELAVDIERVKKDPALRAALRDTLIFARLRRHGRPTGPRLRVVSSGPGAIEPEALRARTRGELRLVAAICAARWPVELGDDVATIATGLGAEACEELFAAIDDPAAFAASARGQALMEDAALARRFPFAAATSDAQRAGRGLAQIADWFALERLEEELRQQPPREAPAEDWDRYLRLAQEAAELRAKIAGWEDGDEIQANGNG